MNVWSLLRFRAVMCGGVAVDGWVSGGGGCPSSRRAVTQREIRMYEFLLGARRLY
jgi:hypothetical protein